MGVKDLNLVQIGKESTWSTPVPQTAKLMGVEEVKFNPVHQAAGYADLRGALAPAHLAALEKVEGKMSIAGLALYEDICYLLDSLFSEATPSGAGPYTRNYTAPTTAAPTPRQNTIAYGQGTDTYGLTSAILNKLTLRGASGAPLRYQSEWIGEIVEPDTLDALSDRAVNLIMGNHGAVYVDTFGGTVGSTAIAATAWSFELVVEANRVLKQYLGNVAPGGYEGGRWKGTLKLSLELNTTSAAYLDSILASSPALYQRLVRLKFSNTANRDLAIDFAGFTPEGPEVFQDRDGVLTWDLMLSGQYDTGAFANWLKATSINSVSAMP
jgi:hypothetical protein